MASSSRQSRSVHANTDNHFRGNLRSTAMDDFNPMGYTVARDNRYAPYPTAQNVYTRSNTTTPTSEFWDLFIQDFVRAGKRVARRSLNNIEMCRYQRALLARGAQERYARCEQIDLKVNTCLGYMSAVGTEAFREISNTNEVVGID